MTNENKLKGILCDHLERALDEISVLDEFAEMGWVGNNLVSHMTDAAWTIIKYGQDVNQYLKENGELAQ